MAYCVVAALLIPLGLGAMRLRPAPGLAGVDIDARVMTGRETCEGLAARVRHSTTSR